MPKDTTTHCENCGCRVYGLGCVNCNEDAYIDQQRYELGMPSLAEAEAERRNRESPPTPPDAGTEKALEPETESAKWREESDGRHTIIAHAKQACADELDDALLSERPTP